MRLTDKRFLNDGFYEPKSKEERLEIQFVCGLIDTQLKMIELTEFVN